MPPLWRLPLPPLCGERSPYASQSRFADIVCVWATALSALAEVMAMHGEIGVRANVALKA